MSENIHKIQLDRTLYKKIKCMDRITMEKTIQNVYDIGFDDAMQLKPSVVDCGMIRRKIGQIKGIGENRLNEVMKVIEDYI